MQDLSGLMAYNRAIFGLNNRAEFNGPASGDPIVQAPDQEPAKEEPKAETATAPAAEPKRGRGRPRKGA